MNGTLTTYKLDRHGRRNATRGATWYQYDRADGLVARFTRTGNGGRLQSLKLGAVGFDAAVARVYAGINRWAKMESGVRYSYQAPTPTTDQFVGVLDRLSLYALTRIQRDAMLDRAAAVEREAEDRVEYLRQRAVEVEAAFVRAMDAADKVPA